ncbi:MAG: WhiB family transcriptional regulator [Acidimicrobiia bacterium]
MAEPFPSSGSWAHLRWVAEAACAGHTRLFFAPLAERPQARARRETKARRICDGCPVLAECRVHARRNGEYGFWGGESEEERAEALQGVPASARHRPGRRR